MNSIDIEILNLDSYDPDIDMVIMYVDIGKMPPKRAAEHLLKVKEAIQPKFEERGFDVIYVARNSEGKVASRVNVISKAQVDSEFGDYDDAMKLTFGD